MKNLLTKKIGRKNKKGFTLIELIVVIAIVAVLAAIGIPTMLGLVDDAKQKAADADAKVFATTAQLLLTQAEALGGGINKPGVSTNTAKPTATLASTDNQIIIDVTGLNYTPDKITIKVKAAGSYQLESVDIEHSNGKTGKYTKSPVAPPAP